MVSTSIGTQLGVISDWGPRIRLCAVSTVSATTPVVVWLKNIKGLRICLSLIWLLLKFSLLCTLYKTTRRKRCSNTKVLKGAHALYKVKTVFCSDVTAPVLPEHATQPGKKIVTAIKYWLSFSQTWNRQTSGKWRTKTMVMSFCRCCEGQTTISPNLI